MDNIFKEFNLNVDKLTDRLTKLAETNLLTVKDIELYNSILQNITSIQNYFNTGNKIDLNLSEAAIEAWHDFETNRAVFFAKPYTPASRKIAVKKVMQLAQGVEEDFINIVEWATAWNYKDIRPNIMTMINIESNKKENTGDLFINSKYHNYINFIHFLRNHNKYFDLDLKAYYNKILAWSESKNKKSNHWGFIALQFIENDINQKKEILLTPTQRIKETLTDKSKLKSIWQGIIKGNKELEQIEPIKLFRLFLTLKTTKKEYDLIEEKHLTEIKKNLPENIKFITYKLKK